MMSFQCPATDYAQSLIIMHNYLMTFLFGIGIFVAFIMGFLVLKCTFQSSSRDYLVSEISANAYYNLLAEKVVIIFYYIQNKNIIKNSRDLIILHYVFNIKPAKELNNINVIVLLWAALTSYQARRLLSKGKKPERRIIYNNFFETIINNYNMNHFFVKRQFKLGAITRIKQKNDYISTILSYIYVWFFANNASIVRNYYNELNYDFVNSSFIANNYYKLEYYRLNDVLWLNRLINTYVKLSADDNSTTILNGLIIEPLLNNNLNSFLAWENVRHSTKLEIVWTLIPTFILFFVAVPSFSLLYGYDEPLDMPVITLKVVGHQWYWSYEYSDYNRSVQLGKTIAFDSYMVHEDDFSSNNEYRLLETDTRVVLPVGATIRVLITSGDVLHSWAVPSLGTKTDAIPGRLNQALLLITRPGTFFGQCSELCGVQHGFMPIVVEGVKLTDYFTFLSLFYTE